MRKVILLVSGLVGLAGQASAELKHLSTSPFEEKVFARSEISGPLVVGLVQASPVTARDISIIAKVPTDWTDLCLSVMTADGQYVAHNSFKVSGLTEADEAALDYPTDHANLLLAAAPGTVGALVSEGRCGSEGGNIAVARWRSGEAAPVPPEKIEALLMVNSFQADEVVAYVGDATDPTDCMPVTGAATTAFDMVCKVALLQGETKVEVLRLRSGSVETSSELTIVR